MKKIFLLFVCLTISVVSFGQDKSALPAKSKMTNADVIQLVAAGLSEQVVIVSIRQTSEKDFDLTPTGLIALKKAGVSDAVILIMQSGDASVTPAAPSDDSVPKDDTVAGIKEYLRQRVAAESRGMLVLSSFSKVNGYEQEITKLYVIEWQAEIQFQQEGWKLGDAFVGYWKDFQISSQNPKTGGINDLLLVASGRGDAKHFNKGAKIRLTGDCVLRKTEQGWRTEEFTVKTTQVLAEGGSTEPSPSATAPVPANTQPVSLEALSETIARGEEAVVNIKYNSAIPGYLYLANGKVTVSKTAVTFSPTIGSDDFTVSPDKIIELVNQPQEASRIFLKVEVKNASRFFGHDIAGKKDFYFYNPGAVAVGTGPGGAGGSISCDGCDDSMSVLYALLEKVRTATDESNKLPTQGQLTAEQIQNIVTKSTAGQFASPLAEKTLAEFLVAESSKTGVPAWFVLAQAKRETSFGSPKNGTVRDGETFEDGTKGNAHNLFNIRPGSSWTGKKLDLGTGSGEFRVYDSYQDSVSDYMRLMSSDTYKGLTLRAIVYKYFPPSDNGGSAATESYIDSIINFAASQGITITRDTVVVGSSTNSFPEIM